MKKWWNNIKELIGVSDRYREILEQLDDLVKKTDQQLEAYSAFYQPIAFAAFDRIPLNEWVVLNETTELMLFEKTEEVIKFVAKFKKGNLNYHNHPDAEEKFTLLSGAGELIVKDRFGKKELVRTILKKGDEFIVDIGLHHRFIVNDKAVTLGELRKVKINNK